MRLCLVTVTFDLGCPAIFKVYTHLHIDKKRLNGVVFSDLDL